MYYSPYLLALLPTAALAGKEASVTKTFKFKEDFFLKFQELPTAIGPDDSGEDMLMSALDNFASTFKAVRELLFYVCEIPHCQIPMTLIFFAFANCKRFGLKKLEIIFRVGTVKSITWIYPSFQCVIGRTRISTMLTSCQCLGSATSMNRDL